MKPFQNIIQLFKNQAVGPIGLECSLEALQLVQLQKVKQRIVLGAKASLNYPSSRQTILEAPQAFKDFIQQAFKTQPFKGRKVVSVPPSGSIRIIPVTYQIMSGQTEQQVILKLMEERLEGNLAEYVMDYIPLKTSAREDQKVALVAAGKKEVIVRYLELLRQAGLQLEALEIGPAAIRRLVSFIDIPKRPPIVLVINFGSLSSYLTVIVGTELFFDEELPFGEETVLKQLSSTLDMSGDRIRHFLCQQEGLISQSSIWSGQVSADLATTITEIVKPSLSQILPPVRRTIEYVSSFNLGQSIEQIYVVGSIARWKGIEPYLSELFNLRVQVIPDLAWFASDPSVNSVKVPEMAVALGLALRGLTSYE